MDALITGGAGFIGSHLAEYLLQQGHGVTVLDDLSTGCYDNVAHLAGNPRFRFEQGSILDTGAVERAFTGTCSGETGQVGTPTPTPTDGHVNHVDTVFHLAAAVGVELAVSHPMEGIMVHIMGTKLVMEAAQRYGCRVMVASSSEIYGKNTSDNISEDDDRVLGSPLKSRWSYSEGKAIEETMAYTYWREMGLRTVIVRLFNMVGPRQHGRYGMVLPRFVHQAITGQPLTVYGDGHQSRCFCYIDDAIPVLADLVQHSDAYGKAFNLGSREETTIEALAQKVIALAGSKSTIHYIPYGEAYKDGFEDMPRRVPDITKVRQLTGFVPRTTLDEIIRMLVSLERGVGESWFPPGRNETLYSATLET
ncbi:MAG: GDP-mannose 4,6-dehydratase [Actinobacteria bacterium]|jgi:UDP-glucose 4-epimerase|nr:GDP-mannose 4,6-dehydratase [Actinomycetota bacterium]